MGLLAASALALALAAGAGIGTAGWRGHWHGGGIWELRRWHQNIASLHAGVLGSPPTEASTASQTPWPDPKKLRMIVCCYELRREVGYCCLPSLFLLWSPFVLSVTIIVLVLVLVLVILLFVFPDLTRASHTTFDS